MFTAFVHAAGGDGEVSYCNNGRHPVDPVGVADTHPPWPTRRSLTANDYVAARVDAEVARPVHLQNGGGTVNGPTLDERGWVQAAVGVVSPDIEDAIALTVYFLAQVEDLAHLTAALVEGELTPTEPADLAVVLVGAEARVNLLQPGDDILQCRLGQRIAQIDADHRSHDPLHVHHLALRGSKHGRD